MLSPDTDSGISSESSSFDDRDSDSGDPCEIVFAKAGRGTWGLCPILDGNLYLTRDLMEGSFVPKDLKAPKGKDVPPPPTQERHSAPGGGKDWGKEGGRGELFYKKITLFPVFP